MSKKTILDGFTCLKFINVKPALWNEVRVLQGSRLQVHVDVGYSLLLQHRGYET